MVNTKTISARISGTEGKIGRVALQIQGLERKLFATGAIVKRGQTLPLTEEGRSVRMQILTETNQSVERLGAQLSQDKSVLNRS